MPRTRKGGNRKKGGAEASQELRLRMGKKISALVAASGNTDPVTNVALSIAMDEARTLNISMDDIHMAIERGTQEFNNAKRHPPAFTLTQIQNAMRGRAAPGRAAPGRPPPRPPRLSRAAPVSEEHEREELLQQIRDDPRKGERMFLMLKDRSIETIKRYLAQTIDYADDYYLARAIEMSQHQMGNDRQSEEDRHLAEAISMSMEKPAKRKPPPPPNKPKHLSAQSRKMRDTYTASRLKTDHDKASRPPTPPKNPRNMSAAATAALARQAQTLSTPRDKQMAERRQKDEIIGKIYAAYSSRHDAPPIGLPAASIKQLKEHLEKVRKRPAGGKRCTKKRHYKHPKKGAKSRTRKGRKDFTTKKTSKVFNRRKHYQRKSAKGVKRRPFRK